MRLAWIVVLPLAACTVLRGPEPAACAAGVWVRGDHRCTPCVDRECEPCTSDVTSECGHHDCVAFEALVLRADGRYLEASLRRLEFEDQLSAIHAPGAESTGDWWIDDERRLVMESDAGERRMVALACDAVTLRRGTELYGVARATLGAAIEDAWTAGDWTEHVW